MSKEVMWFIIIGVTIHLLGWISLRNDKPFQFRRLHNPDYNLIEQKIYNMHWRDFEEFLGKLFTWIGHEVEVTPPERDFGRDLVLDGDTFVEAKHYHTSVVGREILQKLIGSCAMFNVRKAIVITTGQYHQNAFEYADKLNANKQFNLVLYDMSDIMKIVRAVGTSKVLKELGFPIRYWDKNALNKSLKG